MKIVCAPDPILRTVCEPCEVGDPGLKKIAHQMAKAMYKNNGCGLAAPQVGITKRLIVIDCDEESKTRNPIALVNPVLIEAKGNPVREEEACLSCPGISVMMKRKPWVKVRYYDLEGELYEIEGDGLLGRCLQHELDHLDGKTLFESAEPMDRLKAYKDYDIALAAGAKPGEVSVQR